MSGKEVQPTDGTNNGHIQGSVTPFEKFWAKVGNQVFFERTAERLGVSPTDLEEILAENSTEQEILAEKPDDALQSSDSVIKVEPEVQTPASSESQETPQKEVKVFAIDYGFDISRGKRRSRKK